MVDLVREKLPEVRALCQRYSVRELQLLGSAVGEEFDPLRSDIDLVGEMSDPSLDAYFDLQNSLESLFGRKVDLLEKSAVRNPYMIRAIKANLETLYAA